MQIETNNAAHFGDFIRLNELWISEHFSLEDADRALAANPGKVVTEGGYIFSLLEGGQVVGVCALFKESPERFQLARMAVAPAARGKGFGNRLLAHALVQAKTLGATSIVLYSNTALQSAIALYQKHGFSTVSSGPHPVYARCNIVMERAV
jgi:putative acetyltransferase